jgi:hypothetical protein
VGRRRRKSVALSGNRILGPSARSLVIQVSNTGKQYTKVSVEFIV